MNDTSGDDLISEVPFKFEGNGAELGFFFAFALISVVLLLDQLHGNFFRMKIFLMNRDFNLAKNEHVIKCITIFIRVISWFSILLPMLALGVWGAGLIIRAKDFDTPPAAGICVILVGASLFFLLMTFFTLKWNRYSFDIKNGIYFIMTFVCLTAYQFTAIFMQENESIYGVSSIFLSTNCLLMMMIVFL